MRTVEAYASRKAPPGEGAGRYVSTRVRGEYLPVILLGGPAGPGWPTMDPRFMED